MVIVNRLVYYEDGDLDWSVYWQSIYRTLRSSKAQKNHSTASPKTKMQVYSLKILVCCSIRQCLASQTAGCLVFSLLVEKDPPLRPLLLVTEWI